MSRLLFRGETVLCGSGSPIPHHLQHGRELTSQSRVSSTNSPFGNSSEAKPSGTAGLGSCPTDASREGRSRRAVRMLAAILALERLRPQSWRPSDPVESCQPPFRIDSIDTQTVPGGCQGLHPPRCRALPKAPGKTGSALVYAALAPDELGQWLPTLRTSPHAAEPFTRLIQGQLTWT
jgi:hypothetical protein